MQPKLAEHAPQLARGEEAGTAPDDRRFRPDVEGLRAVAVLLVVLYHAGVPELTGGYVGVDVFFVISGFVITGLLLRENQSTGRTSILDFYARRVRRILPAATLTIIVVAFITYLVLGVVNGNNTANDGRWAAVFLSNFHFSSIGTNYLASFRPPSPLQNFWSLSVEEQFYIVYPTLFLILARFGRIWSLRLRLTVALSAVILASFVLSVVQTSSQPAEAYFSPFTRAWELALGALVAVSTPWLRRVPARMAASVTWVGVAAIVVSAFAFSGQTAYPGYLVCVPVLGAGLLIAGGAPAPRFGVEMVLGRRSWQWLGRRSYSLYLWHWPILVIAAEHVGKPQLPLRDNAWLVLIALVVAAASYALVENPIRHLRLPSRRTVVIGLAVIIATVVILSALIAVETAPVKGYPVEPVGNANSLAAALSQASRATVVPASLKPPLSQASLDYGGTYYPYKCQAALSQASEKVCFLGDTQSPQLMVLYGDSHAVMWAPALIDIARQVHWNLVILGKPDCPAALVTVTSPPGVGSPGTPYAACDKWHRWAIRTIDRLKPNLVIVSQDNVYTKARTTASPSDSFSALQWRNGIASLFHAIAPAHARDVFLSNIPLLAQSGPACLSIHLSAAQLCSTPVHRTASRLSPEEKAETSTLGVRYVDTTPWFCSEICTAIVGHYEVYLDSFHVTGTYARYVQNALGQGIGFDVGRK